MTDYFNKSSKKVHIVALEREVIPKFWIILTNDRHIICVSPQKAHGKPVDVRIDGFSLTELPAMCLKIKGLIFMKAGNRKRLLEKQIDVFIEWTTRFRTGSHEWESSLYQFKNFTDKSDICDVTDEDVELYMDFVYSVENLTLYRKQAKIAIDAIRRYYKARSKNSMKKLGRGRPPHISQIIKAKEYRKKGLSYGDIGKLLRADKSLVHRWVKYDLDDK